MKRISKILLGFALVALSMQVQALPLELEPPGDATTDINSNLGNLADINSAFGTSYSDVDLLWKSDETKGLLGSSYEWTDDGSIFGGYIDYVANTAAADCPTCFLIVKSGRKLPAQYLFDLGSWNGTDQIILSNFWKDNWDINDDGTLEDTPISHVEIWGGEYEVPEPGLIGLLAIGLLGMVAARRKKTV